MKKIVISQAVLLMRIKVASNTLWVKFFELGSRRQRREIGVWHQIVVEGVKIGIGLLQRCNLTRGSNVIDCVGAAELTDGLRHDRGDTVLTFTAVVKYWVDGHGA